MRTPPFEVVNGDMIVIEKGTVPEAPVRMRVDSLFSTLASGLASDPLFGVR